ncbi:MAG: hypothetical protein ACXWCM_08845, partial [Acidimicrobiales bacterium]
MAVHGGLEHELVPSTTPWSADTNVTEAGSKPVGTGVPEPPAPVEESDDAGLVGVEPPPSGDELGEEELHAAAARA